MVEVEVEVEVEVGGTIVGGARVHRQCLREMFTKNWRSKKVNKHKQQQNHWVSLVSSSSTPQTSTH